MMDTAEEWLHRVGAKDVPPGGQSGAKASGDGGYERAEEPVVLPVVDAAHLAEKPLPKREFHDEKGFIPLQGVTMLYGDGGTGKSLLALQLAVSTALSSPWIGLTVRTGRVLVFSCEDPLDEIHIRLNSIVDQQGSSLDDLTTIKLVPMAGENCLLATKDRNGVIKTTPVFDALDALCADFRPNLIIIDNAVDVFGGDANDAAQVKQFMHALTRLSLAHGAPLFLLAHPSRAGMANGTGDAGSVHWSNSARSRLYLRYEGPADRANSVPDDPNVRILSRMKANYAAKGEEITLRWGDWSFVRDEVETRFDEMSPTEKAELTFLELLDWHLDKRMEVSPKVSSVYAPTLFAKHPNSRGVTKERFAKAMISLLDKGEIGIVEEGPPTRSRSRIRRVETECRGEFDDLI